MANLYIPVYFPSNQELHSIYSKTIQTEERGTEGFTGTSRDPYQVIYNEIDSKKTDLREINRTVSPTTADP
jgi:hypothetical protein